MIKIAKLAMTVTIWLIGSVGMGVLGTAIGPGIIMLFHALVVGAVGVLGTLVKRSVVQILPERYMGAFITALGVLVGMVILHSDISEALLSFLFLFTYFVLPVYLVWYLVRGINNRLFASHAA